jgi:hypothetical protein
VPNLGPSLIRTLVPLLVTLLGPFAARGLGIDAAQLEQVVSVVLGAVYYLLARLVEQQWPRLGWLLGYPKPPVYEPGNAA